MWYAEPSAIRNAIDYTKFRSHSHDVVIRAYDEAGNVKAAGAPLMRARDPIFHGPFYGLTIFCYKTAQNAETRRKRDSFGHL